MSQPKSFSIKELNGKKLPRTTTILELLWVEGLAIWRVNITAKYLIDKVIGGIKDGWFSVDELMSWDEEKISGIYDEARNYHKEISEGAADIGTRTHQAIEGYLKAKDGEEMQLDDDVVKPFKAFLQWWNDNDVDPLLSEQRIWATEKGGFTGKLDLVARLGKEKTVYVIDFKTSKDIYDNHIMQLASYFYALKERIEKTKRRMDLQPQKAAILRLDKETGWPDFHEFEEAELAKAYNRFLCLVEYWHKTNE